MPKKTLYLNIPVVKLAFLNPLELQHFDAQYLCIQFQFREKRHPLVLNQDSLIHRIENQKDFTRTYKRTIIEYMQIKCYLISLLSTKTSTPKCEF